MLTSGTSETSGLGRARRPRPALTVVVFVVALVAVWPLAGAGALSSAAVARESLPAAALRRGLLAFDDRVCRNRTGRFAPRTWSPTSTPINTSFRR